MRKMRGHVPAGHPLARYFKGHVASQRSRYFTTFESVLGSYLEFTSPVVIPAGVDFEIEVDFYLPSGTAEAELVASDNLNTDGIYIDITGGNVRAFAYVAGFLGAFLITGGAVPVNKLNTIGISVSSIGTAKLFLNDVQQGADADWSALDGNQYIRWVGRRGSGYTDGTPANLRITVAGQQIVNLTISGNGSRSYEVNTAAVLGSELWGSPELVGADWLDSGGGSYAYSGTTNQAVLNTNLLTIGKTYLINADISGRTTGRLEWKGDTGSVQDSQNSNGAHSFLFTAAETGIRFTAGWDENRFDGTVSNISIREIPASTPYASRVNLPDNSERFTKVGSKPWTASGWPNLLKWSSDLTNAKWGAARLTKEAQPDGSMKLIATGGSDPILSQSVNIGGVAGKTVTFSIVAWTDEGQPNGAKLFLYGTNGVEEVLVKDVTLGTTPQRFYITHTFSGAAISQSMQARIDPAHIVAGGEYAFVEKPQLELGSTATAYKPTTASAGRILEVA